MKNNFSLFLAVSLILSSYVQHQGKVNAQKKKVLILGAGAAGITAAKTLYDKGFEDFLVLEAEGYIGGRIKSVDLGGTKIEAGANWIHFMEKEDNPLMALKQKLNIMGREAKFDSICMRDDDGQYITGKDPIFNRWKVVSENLLKMGKQRGEQKDNPPRDMPLSVALKLLGWRSDEPQKKALSWFNIDFEFGANEKETSLNNFVHSPERDFLVKDEGGYWTMFKDFYKDFEDKIRTNAQVKEIKYSDTDVQVTVIDPRLPNTQETFIADYALCTFSSGVLGSGAVTLNPPLPDWKKEAIYRFSPIHFTKIFLKFTEKFWDDEEYIMHASSLKPGNFPVFINIDPEILLSVVTGDEALRIENLRDDEIKKEVMFTLRNMYGGQLKGEISAIFVSRWSTNEFTKGAWGDPVVGTSWGHYANIAGRLNNLFFAGECTSEEYYGYVQGAYFTGRDKAEEIANCLFKKRGTCRPYVPVITSEIPS